MSEDLLLYEPGQPPPQPPADRVRLIDYRVLPWPDGTRVTTELGFENFRVFPACDVMLVNEAGDVLRLSTLVGGIERRPSPTMFLPRLPRGSNLCIVVEMIDGGEIYQHVEIPFTVAGPILKREVQTETE